MDSTTPPLIIALALNYQCWEESEHRCVKNAKVGTTDALLCIAMTALNMIFEAQELGIQTSFLTPETNEILKLLKMRKDGSIPLLIGFGYEKKRAFQKERMRKPLKEMISYETYLGR